jgi:hypothetical protein
MGIIYDAQDLTLGRHVALKFLPDDMGEGPDGAGALSARSAASHRYFDPAILDFDHAKAGENDKAFPVLDKAYADESDGVVWINIEPRADGLRSDPRYAALLKKMGLPR